MITSINSRLRLAYRIVLAMFSLVGVSIFVTSVYAEKTAQYTSTSSTDSPDLCVIWEVVSSPNAGTVNDQLMSVAAISKNDVWAVGYYYEGSSVRALIEHWNGTSWSVVPSPYVSGQETLYGVTAIASNNVWAVGYSNVNTLILHWDGISWSVVPSPNPGLYANSLFEVRAVNANDVWAVGNKTDCQTCPVHTLTEHWDGTSWSVVPSPNVGVLTNSLTGIAAISSNNVWAGGQYSHCDAPCLKSTLTMRWNGTAWTVVPSPSVGAGSNYINRMSAVPSVSAVPKVWAVGFYYDGGEYAGNERTLALYWNGSVWSIVPTPNSSFGGSGFGGVVAISPQNAWAVGGTSSTGNASKTMVQHWNGTSWTVVPSQSPATGKNDLNQVAASSDGSLWAVGAYFNTAYNYRTLIERPSYTCNSGSD